MSYLDNLYQIPIDEGTHTWEEIDQYLTNRYKSKDGSKFDPNNKYHTIMNKSFLPAVHKSIVDKYGQGYTDDQAIKVYASIRKPTKKNNNLKYGLGAAAGGLVLAGLHRYATKNPKSYLGRKLAALKARFGKN